jgi:pentatricopeptide repeat protein
MRERNVNCDTQLYNVMLKELCRASLLDEAIILLEDMSHADLILYSTVINRCSKNGEMNFAWKLYNKMVEKGIKPNLMVYTTLVNGLLTKHEVQETQKLVNTMKNGGIKLDEKLYTAH